MPRCPTCYRRLAAGSRCPSDGTSIRDRPESREERPRLAGYGRERLVGSGGFSTVWRATRASDGAEHALKIARGPGPFADRCFAHEAEVLAAVGSPAVPAFVDRGVLADGSPWLAMELLPGHTLARSLEGAWRPFTAGAVVAIATAVLDNLDAVHRGGYTHGDLKPNNIIVVEHPALATRLIDFGLPAGRAGEPAVAGSLEYIAPEILAGEAATPAADVYSFGVLLYELLTLRVPFAGDPAVIERGHRALQPRPPSELVAVPRQLEELCLACLAKVGDRRPAGVGAIRRRLEGAATTAVVNERERAAPEVSATAPEPIVVMQAELEDPSRLREIEGRGGVVVRQTGRRYVCAFTALATGEPVIAAVRSAEVLSERGVRVALDLADLRVRSRGDTVRVYGAAIDEPERWAPPGDWTGLVVGERLASLGGSTSPDVARAFRRVLCGRPLQPASDHPGFYRFAALPAVDDAAPLVGRDRELAIARSSLTAALETRTPGLLSVSGDSGAGKSRLARELAAMCAAAGDIDVVVTRGERAAADLVGRETIADNPTRAIGDELLGRAAGKPLAIVIDDAHRLGDELCDAIEYATLDAADTPLWIAVLGHPRMFRRRPRWGARANRHDRCTLEPLDELTAMGLAAALLRPADPPPAETLKRLASWSGGNPFFLVELVAALKRRGVVRQRATGSYFVATTELASLPAIPVSRWLAAHRLEALPIEVAALARLCSVLGAGLDREELAALQRAARSGESGPAVDIDVGLRELEEVGIIAGDGERWSFVEQPTCDSIYELIGPAERDRLHAAAMAFWTPRKAGGSHRALERFARHAAVAEPAAAAATYLDLGDGARLSHAPVEADLHYTAALASAARAAGDHDEIRARARGGRGAVRYQMQRLGEAIDDLEAATELAAELGDDRRRAGWLLELATVLDWADRYSESADRVAEAQELVERLGEPGLEARCIVGLGRTRWREENIAGAIELLERGANLAEECGNHETRIIALLLLPLALVFAGERDRAQRRFDELIELCERIGDRFHLCAAYTNRMFLNRNAPDLAMDDLRRAKQLAREVGHLSIERVVSHNLAEIVYWSGDDDESLALARRGFELQERLMAEPVADDSLLLARIHASRGEWSEVDRWLSWIAGRVAGESLAPSDRIAIRMLELLSRSAVEHRDFPGRWDSLLIEAGNILAAEEHLEVMYYRVRAALLANEAERSRRALAQAAPRLESCSVWAKRFRSL